MKKIIPLILTCIFTLNSLGISAMTEKTIIHSIRNDTFDMVIITPNIFVSELQPLVEHKNNYEISTILKRVEDIYNEFEGRDNPEKIKYFIKQAIEQWNIKYILIAGDINLVPIRYAAINYVDITELPTDLYYADIYDENMDFCSWDSNHNDIFGEWEFGNNDNDFVDLYPDVNIGRLPCKNNREITTVVKKIITYETQTNNQEWFNKIILMGGDTFPSYEGFEGEEVTEEIAQKMQDHGFNIVKLWTSLNNYKPIRINYEISKGAGFIAYSGHGFENGLSTYTANGKDNILYYTPYLLGIFNGDKLPIVYFSACLTACLDYKKYGIKLPCFAWFIVKKPYGGAIASIGATRVAFSCRFINGAEYGYSQLTIPFFENFEPGIMVSDMLRKAQEDYLDYCYNNQGFDPVTLEEFILIGDPSLKVGGYS